MKSGYPKTSQAQTQGRCEQQNGFQDMKQKQYKEQSSQDQDNSISLSTQENSINRAKSSSKIVSNNKQIYQYFHQLYNLNQKDKDSFSNLNQNLENTPTQGFISLISNQNERLKNQIEKKLIQDGTFKKASNYRKEFTVLFVKRSINSQVVTIQMQLGFYQTKLQILNSPKPSEVHENCHLNSFGGFGSIYFLKFMNQNYAIKCINFNINTQKDRTGNQIWREEVIKCFKQYFFALLFSVLQIGPKVSKVTGFDLLLTHQCIQFSTQICQKRQVSEDDKLRLKLALRMMHALRIVHRDIKPENIMFSPSFKKHVFIDFGCCQFIDQRVGQKTQATFLGTTIYCTAEVLGLLKNNKAKVDLYYNDLYGLTKSYKYHSLNETSKQLQVDMMSMNNKISSLNQIFESPFLLVQKIKHLLLKYTQTQIEFHWKILQKRHSHQLQTICIDFGLFMIELKVKQQFYLFYFKYLSRYLGQLEQFQFLKKIFSDKQIFVLSFMQTQKNLQRNREFNNIDALYRQIQINYQNCNQQEKNILKRILNKTTIENYLFCQIPQNLSNSKKIDIFQFFLVGVYYCTLVQNKYNVEFQQKIKLCSFATKFCGSSKGRFTNRIKVTYKSYEMQYVPLIFFFYFFVCQIWQGVPSYFKQRSLTLAASSLILLGYPDNLIIQNLLLRYQCVIQGQQQVFNKILRLWKVNFISNSLTNMLYDKYVSRYQLQLSQEQIQQLKFSNQSLFMNNDLQLKPFLSINLYFHQKFWNRDNLEEAEILSVISDLTTIKHQQFPFISKSQLIQWKTLIYLIFKSLLFGFLMNHHEEIKFTYHCKEIQLQDLKNQFAFLPWFFNLLLMITQEWNFSNRMKIVFQIIDETINEPSISVRYYTDRRLKLSYFQKDFVKVQQLIKFVLKNTQQTTSVLNLMTMINHTEFILEIYMNQFGKKKSEFYPILYKQRIFDPILERSLAFAINFRSERYYRYLKNIQQLYPEQARASQVVQNCVCKLIFLLVLIYDLEIYDDQKVYLVNEKSIFHLQKQLYVDFNKKIATVSSNYMQYNSFKVKTFFERMKKFIEANRESYFKYLYGQQLYKQLGYQHHEKQYHQADQYLKNLTLQRIQSNQVHNLFIFKICVSFLTFKVKLTSFDKVWCQHIIKFYFKTYEKNDYFNPMINSEICNILFLSFIVCEKSFAQTEQFLLSITSKLKTNRYKVSLKQFFMILEERLSCDCIQCFPKKPKNWKVNEFIEYLANKSSTYSNQERYMSLVFYKCLNQNNISIGTKYKLIQFMRKAFQYLPFYVKKYLFDKFYFFQYQCYNLKTGIQIFLDSLEQKLKKKVFKSSKDVLAEQIQTYHEISIKFDKKMVRKHINLLKKYIINKKRYDNLDQVCQKILLINSSLLRQQSSKIIKQIYKFKLIKYLKAQQYFST